MFIKPVLNSGNPYPATTSPLAIRVMIGLLKEKGAGRIIAGEGGQFPIRRTASARRRLKRWSRRPGAT